MKNIFKYISMATTALAVAFALSACDDDDDDYTVGEADPSDVSGVYFSTYTASYELDPDEGTELTMTLSRHNTASALSVSLEVAENTDNVFDVPSTVSFASGEADAEFTVSFPTADVGIVYTLALTVPDEYVGIYTDGYWETSLSIERVKWNSLGNASYTDDFITTFWSTGNPTYEVEIQEKDSAPGLYRLVNPYGAAYPYNEVYDDGTADWDMSQDWYFYIDAQDPEGVYIELQETGMDWGYGNIIMGSLAYYYMAGYGYTLDEMKSAGYTGTLENGVITFPASTLLICMPDYSSSYYYANLNGAFMVVLPGYSAPSDDEEEGGDDSGDTGEGDEESTGWTALYTGDYEYSQVFTGTDPGLTLYVNDEDSTLYKITNWCYGVDFCFTFDSSTGGVVVDDQYTGYDYNGSYSMYVDDLTDYTGETSYGYSYYSPANSTFYFAVIYYCSLGYFGYGYETFTITGEASTSSTSSITTTSAASKFITIADPTLDRKLLRYATPFAPAL